MDLLPIKSKDEQGAGAAPKSSGGLQLANIAATFNEIMKKTGAMLQMGSSALADPANMITPAERIDAPLPPKEKSYDDKDAAAADNRDQVSHGEDGRDEAEPHHADAADDRPHDGMAKNGGAPRDESGDAPRQDASSADDAAPVTSEEGSGEKTAQKTDSDAPKKADTGQHDGDKASAGTEAVATANTVATAQANPGLDISVLIQTAEVTVVTVQTTVAPAVADAALAEAAARAAAATGGTEPGKVQNAAKPGEHGLETKTKATANGAAPLQAPVTDSGEAANGIAGNKTAEQAAALARALGGEHAANGDAPLAEDVPVTGERRAASTTPAAATSSDAGRPGQHGQPNAGSAAVNPAMTPTAQQAAAQTQTAQAATGQQAVTGDAKAIIQGVQSTNTTSAHAGTGEAGTTGQPANTAETNHGQRTAATQAPQAPRFVHAGPGFSEQISVQISKAAAEGLDKINIQLRPAELGRIQVQLNMGADGQVSAAITADNRTTLELLQRDAKGLEQALQNAGLDLNSGDLTFNLRERQDQGQPEGGSRFAGLAAERPAAEEPALEELLNPAYRGDGIRTDGRVNILT